MLSLSDILLFYDVLPSDLVLPLQKKPGFIISIELAKQKNLFSEGKDVGVPFLYPNSTRF